MSNAEQYVARCSCTSACSCISCLVAVRASCMQACMSVLLSEAPGSEWPARAASSWCWCPGRPVASEDPRACSAGQLVVWTETVLRWPRRRCWQFPGPACLVSARAGSPHQSWCPCIPTGLCRGEQGARRWGVQRAPHLEGARLRLSSFAACWWPAVACRVCCCSSGRCINLRLQQQGLRKVPARAGVQGRAGLQLISGLSSGP